MKESITNQRKWNLIAGGSDPANDVVSAELCQGIEDAMLHAISERDTARMYADRKWNLRHEFHHLFGTDDIEQAVAVVREMKNRITRLEEAGDGLYEAWRGYGFTKDNRLAAWRKAKETQ